MKAILVAAVILAASVGPWSATTATAAEAGGADLKAGRWSERKDKSGKRMLTVWVKNESMADFKGTLAIVIRGKGEREEQRSEVAAAVPVHQERAVEVAMPTSQPWAGIGQAAPAPVVGTISSVEVQSVSAAIAAK